ncbi:MAG: ATP-binding protein [Aeromicrobium sp.]
MDTSAGLVIAGAIGAVVGAMVTYLWRFSERQQHDVVESTPLVPPGAELVLSVLSSSAVLIDSADTVVKASAPAIAMGIINDDRLEPDELMALVRQVRTTELSVLSPRSSQPLALSARVAPLSSRLMLVLVEDRTRERRVEAVRRDFVGNVSHELKTPVGAIRLLAEAVHEASDDPEAVKRFSDRMLIESERLSRLVQQVIELSRLQGDDPLEAPAPVPLDGAIDIAVDTSAIDAVSKHIAVVTSGVKGVEVLGNSEQLTAAISNLVANAVSYSESGSTVLVSTKVDDHNVSISVVDQGIGIPNEEIDRIFERFYRVDPARHRSTGGTGLGLSIVKHVAASHGGDVNVWSVEGQGSTFTLTLPRYISARESQEADR